MALKAPRAIVETDISLTCSTVTERGVITVYQTGGSGVALGDAAGSCQVATNASGLRVAGLLMNDVVTYDTTRYHGNFHRDETLQNERCNLLKKGRVTTNMLVSGQTPAAGDTAYLGASGNLTGAFVNIAATPKVGEFVGSKDSDGYVTVDINLPGK